jgi:hypothetical protein
MTSHPNEEHILELVEWLEKTGHQGDASKLFSSFIKRDPSSCKEVGYEFKDVETNGIFEVRFWFPVTELEKVCPITDEVRFRQWLDVISVDGIQAAVLDHKKLGKCVLVRRLHFIPVDKRQEWLSAIPSEDFGVLARLLNLQKRESSDN